MDNEKRPHPSDKLEKLQERLNSPHENFSLRGRKDLQQKSYSLDDDWTKTDDKPIFGNIVPPKRMSIFTKLLIIAATFFVGASAYGGYVFLSQSSPVENSEEIDIKILAPVSIGAGEEYSFDILIQNNNPVPLQTVDLIIEYPEGSKAAGDLKTAQVRTREYLGDIDPGEIVKRKQTVALFGPEGEEKEIEARIEYRLPETSAIFERKKSFDVALQSSPIRLVVDTVKEHIVGQEINFEITLTSNSNETLSDVMLTAEYPFGFTLTESSQKPQNAKKNMWTFEELKPKEIKKISLTGDLQGQNEEERVFHFNAGLADEKNPAEMGVTFTSVINSILLQKPFFAVKINFDGDEGGSEVIKEAGERIRAIVVYTNNLNDRIRDAEIELKLSGEVLDKTSVSVSDGFYQSNTNTIVWNQSTNTSFDELRPRTNKETQFTFAPKPLGTKTSLIKNPEIIFDLKLTGIRVSENDVEEKIETEIIKHIKFTSDVTFDSSIYYGTGPFANTGPMPPKAEKDTEYTVTWTISNTSNNLEDGRITASLPTYVKWNNKISPDGADVIFDPQTRQITWDVGSVPAGAGYGTSPARSASFQVTLTPSISQIHSSPLLITNQLFEARDTFTNTGIEEATQDDTIRPEDLRQSLEADKVVE